MLKRISHELKHHVPFTLGGTVLGIAILVAMSYLNVNHEVSHVLFKVLHPAHVLLSAMVTAGMYRLYGRGRWWATILIGYFGAIGIATLSDSLIPYLGEVLHGLPRARVHAGFIEEWYLVHPLALAGIAIAFFWPRTEFPHAGHVLLSTFASLAHMLMAMEGHLSVWTTAQLGIFLFLAVWIPCCTSDIFFPLLFVKKGSRPPCKHCQRDRKEAASQQEAARDR